MSLEDPQNKKINIELSGSLLDNITESKLNEIIYIDNLSRIMSYCGYNIDKEFYFNDDITTINNIGNSVKERYKQLCGKPTNSKNVIYNEKIITEIAEFIYKYYQNIKLDADVEFFINESISYIIEYIKRKLDTYRINFNIYSTAKELQDNYLIEDMLTTLRYTNNCYIEDDNLLIKTSTNTADILINKDGTYTDFSINIAHLYNKSQQDYDKLIFINNHNTDYNISNIHNTLELLGVNPNNIEIKFITKDTLKVETQDINELRYMYATSNIDKNIKSLNEIELIISNINNIIKNNQEIDESNNLNNDTTYNILNKINEYKDILIMCCKKLNPTLLIEYILELIDLTNIFIENVQTITEQSIKILTETKIIINNSFKLIGIIPKVEI